MSWPNWGQQTALNVGPSPMGLPNAQMSVGINQTQPVHAVSLGQSNVAGITPLTMQSQPYNAIGMQGCAYTPQQWAVMQQSWQWNWQQQMTTEPPKTGVPPLPSVVPVAQPPLPVEPPPEAPQTPAPVSTVAPMTSVPPPQIASTTAVPSAVQYPGGYPADVSQYAQYASQYASGQMAFVNNPYAGSQAQALYRQQALGQPEATQTPWQATQKSKTPGIPSLMSMTVTPPTVNNSDTTKQPSKRIADVDLTSENSSSKKTKNDILQQQLDEESEFDIQFQKWEQDFNTWREQNANHPDKKAYKEYELKFLACRNKLLERREQMRAKRNAEKLALDNAQQVQDTNSNINRSQSSSNNQSMSKNDYYNNQFEQKWNSEGPKTQPPNQDRSFNSDYQKDPYTDSFQVNDNSQMSFLSDNNSNSDNFLKNSGSKGIPGLDLVHEEEKKQDVIEIPDDPVPKPDLKDAISSGINAILGDQKLLSMLSIMTKCQNPKEIGKLLASNKTLYNELSKSVQEPGGSNTSNTAANKNTQEEFKNNSNDTPRSNVNNFDRQNPAASPKPGLLPTPGMRNFAPDKLQQNFQNPPPNFNSSNENMPNRPNSNNMRENNFSGSPRDFQNQGTTHFSGPSRGFQNQGPNNFDGPMVDRQNQGTNNFSSPMHDQRNQDSKSFSGPMQDRQNQGPNNFSDPMQDQRNQDSNNFSGPMQDQRNQGPNNFSGAMQDRQNQGLNNVPGPIQNQRNQGPNNFSGPMLDRQNQGPNNFSGPIQDQRNQGPNNFAGPPQDFRNQGSNNMNLSANREGRNSMGSNNNFGQNINDAYNNFENSIRDPMNDAQDDFPRQNLSLDDNHDDFPQSNRGDFQQSNRGDFQPNNRGNFQPNRFNMSDRNMPPNSQFDNRYDDFNPNSGNQQFGSNKMNDNCNRPPMEQNRNKPNAQFGNRFNDYNPNLDNRQFGRNTWEGNFNRQNMEQSRSAQNIGHEPRSLMDIPNLFDMTPKMLQQISLGGGFHGPNNFNRPMWPQNNRNRDYDILPPAKVVDYGHKPAPFDLAMSNVQTFDYGHKSQNNDDKNWKTKVPKFSPPVNVRNEPIKRDTPSRFNRPESENYRNNRETTDTRNFSQSNYDDKNKSFDSNRSMSSERNLRDSDSNRKSDEFSKDRYNRDRYDRNGRKDRISRFDSRFERDKTKRQDENKSPEEKKDKEEVKKKNEPVVILIEDILNKPGRDHRPTSIVIILRGPPGSGKTHLAKLIKDNEQQQGGAAPRILSLDDYFMVEKESIVEKEGRKVTKMEMQYEYDASMEQTYRDSLVKSFKKTLTDGFFNFVIVDCINNELKQYEEMWTFARQKNFQVYVCQLELDLQYCLKHNIHNRSESDISSVIEKWEAMPNNQVRLDVTSLLQNASINDVVMEDAFEEISDKEDEFDVEAGNKDAKADDKDDEEEEVNVFRSKWDNADQNDDHLARLDGTSKPLRHQTMEEYLAAEWEPNKDQSGKKRVRWADIEERQAQEKMRDRGFVVGQTDWDRMLDPTGGSSALTQTKYIERVTKQF